MSRKKASDYLLQIDELIRQAYGMPRGPTQVALWEEAVRIADHHGDQTKGFTLRLKLIEVSQFSARPDLTLVHFSWCLAFCDANTFNSHDLLWRYKWVVSSSAGFPQIPLSQIRELQADMKRRYEAYGSTLSGYWQTALKVARSTGDTESVKSCYRLVRKTRRDNLSDCLACDLDMQVEQNIQFGLFKRAIQLAQPLVERRQTCAEVPERTIPRLLVPLVKLGRVEEAMEFHVRNIKAIAKSMLPLDSFSRHLEFMVVTDNTVQAIHLLGKLLPRVTVGVTLDDTFDLWLATRLLFLRLADTGKTRVKLRIPEEFGLEHVKGQYELADLVAWLDERIDDLATRFDTRNGNNYFRRRADAVPQTLEWLTPLPVPGKI